LKIDFQTIVTTIAFLGLPYALAMLSIGIKYGFKKDVVIELLISSALSASAYIYLYPVPLVFIVKDIAIFAIPALLIWVVNLLGRISKNI
jgi:hypothetical protein